MQEKRTNVRQSYRPNPAGSHWIPLKTGRATSARKSSTHENFARSLQRPLGHTSSQLLHKPTCVDTEPRARKGFRPTQPLQKRQNAREDASVIAKLTKRTQIERFCDISSISEGRYYSLLRILCINCGQLREPSSAVDTFRAICESKDAARCIFIAQTSKSPASRRLNNEEYSCIGKPRPQRKQPNTQSFRALKAHCILHLRKPRNRTARAKASPS